jgi:AcrR family transcriptional regulator
MSRTQAQRRAATRERLLRAAAARFAAEGIDRASVDAIAYDADRTSGSVYAHFGSKEGLLTALLDSWKNDVVVAATAEVAVAATPEERLFAIWRNFADPPEDGTAWVQLEHELWLYATRNEGGARDALAQRYRDVWAQVHEELAVWRGSGEIDPPVPERALGPLLVGVLIGLEMQHRLDPDAVDEEVAYAGLAALLGVVGTRATPATQATKEESA